MRRYSLCAIVFVSYAVVLSSCGLLFEDDLNGPKVDVSGVWAGTEVVTRSNDNTIAVDNVVSNVRLDLVQTGSHVSGTYVDNNLLTGSVRTFDIFGAVTADRLALFDIQDGSLGYIATVGTTADADGHHMTMDFSLYDYGRYATNIGASKESVTIVATGGTATEESASPGEFTVTRNLGSAVSALTVNFTVGGTATAGADYVLTDADNTVIGRSVTIHADNTARSATIRVVPVNDTAPDTNESVIVTLAAGKRYTVGPTDDAVVTIQDTDVSADIR